MYYTITDNFVDGFTLRHLKETDLMMMLPGKIGIVRKMVVLLQRKDLPMNSQIEHGQETCSPVAESGSRSSGSDIGDNDDPELSNHTVTQQNEPCTSQEPCTSLIRPSLPKYSIRVQNLLEQGKIIEDFDCFIEETAYHLLASSDICEKYQYEDVGRSLVEKYPKIAFTQGKQPWSFITKKLSQKVRNIRWRRKKRLNKSPRKKSRIYAAVAPQEAVASMSFTECQEGIQDALQKNDKPQLNKLMRLSLKDRRSAIQKLEDGAVTKIVQQFPLLELPEFISREFESVIDLGDVKATYNELMPNLSQLLGMPQEDIDDEEDQNTEEQHELDIFLALSSKLKYQGQSKLKPVLEVVEAVDVDLRCGSKSPPRLVLSRNGGSTFMDQAWIVADGIQIECGVCTMYELIYNLMAAYYAWDLAYPKQYQLLGFVQYFVLRDTKSPFFKSTAYTKFEKQLLELTTGSTDC